MMWFLLLIFIIGLYKGWWDKIICKWFGGDCDCQTKNKKSDK